MNEFESNEDRATEALIAAAFRLTEGSVTDEEIEAFLEAPPPVSPEDLEVMRRLGPDPLQAIIEGRASRKSVEATTLEAFVGRLKQIAAASADRRDAREFHEEGQATKPAPTVFPNVVARAIERLGVAADKINRYCDLSFFSPQFAAGGNLAGESTATEAETPRVVVLAEEFTASDLSRIPWAGPKLKLSKTVEAKKGTAIYHAFVTSIKRDAPQTGTLRIVLITPDGQTTEARLQANDRKKMFQGADLPADSSELRYTLVIES